MNCKPNKNLLPERNPTDSPIGWQALQSEPEARNAQEGRNCLSELTGTKSRASRERMAGAKKRSEL